MIGKKLYHYLTMRGVGEYEVIGQDDDFIIAKCLVCKGCVIKLNRIDGCKNKWKYVTMMENCGQDEYVGDDGEIINNEYMWHYDSPYFESLTDCKKWKGREIIDRYKKDLEKSKKHVAYLEKQISEIELWMGGDKAEKH
jgi:hypothetical protein